MLRFFLRELRWYRDTAAKKKRRVYLNTLRQRGLKLGSNVKFAGDIFLDPSHCFLISIGNNVTFAPNVRIIAHDASTKQFLGFTRIAQIRILDDCFIGDSVVVLPGVTIGPRAIVGAGSVVTKDIPENTVAVGCPARAACTLEDYLLRRKQAADRWGVFSKEYSCEDVPIEKRNEVLSALTIGEGFIV